MFHISDYFRQRGFSWISNTYLTTSFFYVDVECVNYLLHLCYTISNYMSSICEAQKYSLNIICERTENCSDITSL